MSPASGGGIFFCPTDMLIFAEFQGHKGHKGNTKATKEYFLDLASSPFSFVKRGLM
jgi:hypothetical protein